MQDERLYELIEQYLEGTMTAPERESFEQLVNADQKVRDTLELHRELAQSLCDTQLEAFRQTLNEMDGLTNDDGVVRIVKISGSPRAPRYLTDGCTCNAPNCRPKFLCCSRSIF